MATWQLKGRSGERWTQSEGEAAIAAWRSSGKSMSAFAAEHGLNDQRIGWWRKRLEGAEEAEESRLLPVTIAPTRVFETAAVRVQSGAVEIEVIDPSRVPPQWVAELIALSRGAR